jgi:hypothetical protein
MLLQERELLVPRFEPVGIRELDALASEMGISGHVHVVKRNGDGEISYEALLENIITQVGDQMYAEQGAGIGTPPGRPTGMRLGQGTTAPAKTGAGGAIVTYVTASQVAITATFPTSSLNGALRRITWKGDWAAGVATANGIAEAVITNESPLTNVAGTAANTISRVLLAPVVDKGANDTLAITWSHDLGT